MKKDGHPSFRDVLFEDISNGIKFLIGSTVKTKETIIIDGITYPYYRIEVSSESHHFYTGAKNKIIDTTGRVEKFNQRFSKYKRS
jgi:large subunit ribosomal protein L31